MIVAKVGDGSRCLFLWVCVIPDPRGGTSTVDGGIWEAGEVLGGHRMGMRCRCGVLVMTWGSDGAEAVENQRFA